MRAKILVTMLVLVVLLSSASTVAAAHSKTDYVKYRTDIQRNEPPIESESKDVTVTPPAPTPPTPSPSSPPSITAHFANPDFTIGISPPSRSVTRGQSTSYTVTVTSVDGYDSMISLSVSGLPSNSTGSLSPSSVSLTSGGSAASTLGVTTNGSTATGTHTLTVTGTGSRTRSARASLTVQQPVPLALPRTGSQPTYVPVLKAYDRGSRYDPCVISYYDMTAAGWDASKAAANVMARAGGSANIPTSINKPPQTASISSPVISFSTSPKSPPPSNSVSAAVSIATMIIKTLFSFRLF